VKQLAIPLSNQKTVAKWLVIAIRLRYQNTIAKSLVIAVQRRHVTGEASRLREPLLGRPSRTGSCAHRVWATFALSASFTRRRLV